MTPRTTRPAVCLSILVIAMTGHLAAAEALPVVRDVEFQPLRAGVRRVVQALDQVLGAPLSSKQQAELNAALQSKDADKAIAAIQKVLDPLCLAGVNVNPESRVKVVRGPAAAKLMQHGWRVFLVKVHNEAGVTAPLRCLSPNATEPTRSSNQPDPKVPADRTTRDRWLAIQMHDKQPLNRTLSGLKLEYRVIALYSRDAGKREAKLMFDVGQGTQDLGFRNELNVLFQAEPAIDVTLEVIDHDGKPTMGQFVFRDTQGRVYPSRARRLAPDFFFHDQIYRNHGETVTLAPGKYEVIYTRGPEYLVEKRTITVPAKGPHREAFRLKRWIKLTDFGWYSGDHHVHAAGCKHYDVPSQGVKPEDMMRHILGEDLNVGCVLTWGPCWYFQKQFFSGEVDKLSKNDYLMRYDVEVSGFPSSHAGHLCLLRLKEDDYPGTKRIEEWPSWDLPVLKWGKEQGGVVGYSHSGWGLKVNATSLPTYEMPPFDGIGANEYIVDVTHGVCDFISAVDTPSVWELNIWYHTLNCGYTCRISGETDFPCIYGERVGLGRAYVKLDTKTDGKPLTYDRWVHGIRDGKSYCCDGLSHLFDFNVNGLGVGEKQNATSQPSVLAADGGGKLNVKVRAAAFLEQKPKMASTLLTDFAGQKEIRELPLEAKPYWHVERARVGETRTVPVELIVNGHAVAKKTIPADGSITDLTFDYQLKHSSWVALRIFPACHTNPVFVEVDGKPVRASKKSARWCLEAVDKCWQQKSPRYRASEKQAAAAAYEVARQAYRKILAESVGE